MVVDFVYLWKFQGTQIQATMFNAAARKFYDRFEMGKVYYISRGSLKLANKQFKTVQNDYEMTLNENSEVEEARNEEIFTPEIKFNFVPIDELGTYVNQKELIGKKCFLYRTILVGKHWLMIAVNNLNAIFISRCYWCCSKCFSYYEH